MPAGSLQTAAEQAYAHLYPRWIAGTLDADMTAFLDALVAIFPLDGSPDQRTVSNWIVVGRNVVQETTIVDDYEFFNDAVEMVYRVCLAADDASIHVIKRITVPQAAAVLAAYNATLD
jgi:hypothetical protein